MHPWKFFLLPAAAPSRGRALFIIYERRGVLTRGDGGELFEEARDAFVSQVYVFY